MNEPVIIPAGQHKVIVDDYFSRTGNQLSPTVTRELILEDGAELQYFLLQGQTGGGGQQFQVKIRQQGKSLLQGYLVTMGTAHVENDIVIALEEEGAECHFDGLYYVTGQERVENRLQVDHLRPHGFSRLFFKGILDGEAKAAFHGRVIVHPNAVKTDANQTNKNLLLSRQAEVDPRPELEIYNNDVKCSHGATVGRLDPDALYYLRSRGIAEPAARKILVRAFAQEIFERMDNASVRAQCETRFQGLFT